jgi:flagellar protein FlaG
VKISNMGLTVNGAYDVVRQEKASTVNTEEVTNSINNENRPDLNTDSVINNDMLDNSIKEANKELEQYNRVIERSVHEVTHTIIYVLRDTQTNEIIREFPTRKIQDMIAKMWEMAGLLVDERR